jgi:type IV secretory pathway VirB4 component
VKRLGELDHFEEFYRYFNASAPDCADIDYASLYDPDKGIIENCFNGEAAPLSKPDEGYYLDGYYHGILVVKSLPKTTFSGMVEQLTNLDMLDYAITVNISPLDVMREIEKEEGAYEKLQNTIQHSPKLRMLAAMQKKGQKISRLMSNEVLPYKAQFILRCWDQDKAGLRAKLAALRSAISKLSGAKYYDPALPTSARNYFYAAVPGWCWDNYDDFSHYIEDANLANLLPVSATPTGDLANAEALYDGANRNLIGVRTFAGRPGAEQPQHGVMFGMSGAGKSVNMIDLLTQTEPYYDYAVLVEEGLSYGNYTETVVENAKPIIIQPNGTLTFNYLDTGGLPLSSLQIANATALCQLMAGACQDEDRNRLRGARLSGAIRQLYRDYYEDWRRKHPEQQRELARTTAALQKWLAERLPPGATMLDAFVDYRDFPEASGEKAEWLASITDGEIDQVQRDQVAAEECFRLSFASLNASEMPTHSQLQELLSMDAHGANGDDSRHLAQLLEPWCSHGNYGAILDGENNVDLRGKIAHFELGYIPESAQDLRAVAGFLITNHVRNEVMTRRRDVRKRVILEELSAFLTIPDGDRITREFYERMRKFNCWVFSVIQQFGRFYDSPVRTSVMGNSRMLFLLKQRDRQDLDRVSEAFPLPEVTQSAISSFPEPKSFSSFVYYREEDGKPVIANARNRASEEMLRAASSNGAGLNDVDSSLLCP